MNINYQQVSYQRIHAQPAYILHTKAYQNTSLLIDAFTAEYGRIRLIAKGARRVKSNFAGKLQVFIPLLISWSGKSELYTLTDADFANDRDSGLNKNALRGKALLSAYYLNELILRFMSLEDPHTEIFYYYVNSLNKLQTKKNIESTLRNFESILLDEVGYRLLLSHEAHTGNEVEANQQYYYVLSEGPVKLQANSKLPDSDGIKVMGQTLLELERGSFTSKETLKQAKQLMRAIIAKHLAGKPLKTRTLFQSNIL